MEVFAEKFDDIKILRYEVPGFEKLDLKKKLYIYYLTQATIAGRDILWDQHGKYNLLLRDILEAIYVNGENKSGGDWEQFEIYLKKVWFASGPHHHYSTDKFTAGFSKIFFKSQVENIKAKGALSAEHLSTNNLDFVERLIFDSEFMFKRVNFNAPGRFNSNFSK